VEGLKFDSDGDGVPETVIPPSRVSTRPQTDDFRPPTVSVFWSRTHRAEVTAADNSSGVKRVFYRLRYTSTFNVTNNSTFSIATPTLNHAVEIVTEDNAGNRSDVMLFSER